MARVLLILSIVLTLVTAGLGFVAKQKVDELQTTLLSTRRELNQTKATLVKTKAELEATKKELDATKQQLDEKTAELAKTKMELDDTQKKLTEANAAVEEKAKTIADLNEKLSKIPSAPGEDIGKKIEQMQADLEKTKTELAESKQVVETLTQKTKEKEEALVVSENTVKAYKYNVVKNGLSGRILAFNPGWNFVVLSIGDKAGLKAGVNMVVTRGNSMIAKVKVTSVEPNTAIADIVPGTMRGDRVQAGDTVIYEGAR